MKSTTSSKFLALGLGASLLGSAIAIAQDAATTDDSKPAATETKTFTAEEIAERRASIPLIETRLDDRVAQIKELHEDMERLDSRIEGRIDKIVSTLAGYRDSNQSKTRVARTKLDVMEGLGNVVGDYKRLRDQLLEDAKQRNSGITEEDASGDLEALNKKADKRIDQMIVLSKSFTEHKDYDKYKEGSTYYGRGGWGWGVSVQDKNPDFAQNRREVKHTDSQRRQMVEALRKSIEKIESRITLLEDLRKRPSTTEQEKEVFAQDLKSSEETLKSREAQLSAMLSSDEISRGEKAMLEEDGVTVPQGDPKKISRNEAHDLELLIHEIAQDIERDMNELFRKYDELKSRRAQARKIQANLEARKQWLVDYDGAHPGE